VRYCILVVKLQHQAIGSGVAERRPRISSDVNQRLPNLQLAEQNDAVLSHRLYVHLCSTAAEAADPEAVQRTKNLV
jgi:hypothetical protein